MSLGALRALRSAALVLLGVLVLAAIGALLMMARLGPMAPLAGPNDVLIEPSAPAGDAEAAAAARQCLERADAQGRALCVEAWAADHRGQCVDFAAALVRGAPPELALALRALRAAPASDEKSALLMEIGGAALARGMLDEAEEALMGPAEVPGPPRPTNTAKPAPPRDGGAPTGHGKSPPTPAQPPEPPPAAEPPPRGRDELREAAEPMIAELREKQGRWGEAFRLHAEMAEQDPTAEEHVVKAVQMLLREGKSVPILEYCRSLQEGAGGGADGPAQRRPLQVLACLREGLSGNALSRDTAEPMILDALATIPALRLEELRRLAPVGLRVVEAASTCAAKGAPPAPGGKGKAWRGREAAVFVRLAEGEKDEAVRLCYLRLAKDDCLDAIKGGKRCSNLWSFGMYLQLLAKLDKDRLGGELGALIESDKGLREGPAGPGARETDEQILRALFDIHLVLAHVLTTQPELAGDKGVLSPAFHVKRAQDLWEKLSPGKAFPEEMLPEGARAFLERRPPPAGARRVRPQ